MFVEKTPFFMPNPDHLQQSIIITGAGTGIGFEIAVELAEQGYYIVLNDLSEALANDAVAHIRHQGGQGEAIAGDASSPETITRLIETAGGERILHALIANAGITVYGDFLSYERSQLDEILNTNIRGSFFLAQAAAHIFVQQRKGGSILFTSSVTGHQAHRNLVAYGMTKAALEMLAKGLVAELSPYQITVNALAPGATLTERTRQFPGYENTWSKLTPMGRPALPRDIAKAASFLISDHARHITGQTLVIDGGWSSMSPEPEDK